MTIQGELEKVALATGAKIAIHKDDGALLKDSNCHSIKVIREKKRQR